MKSGARCSRRQLLQRTTWAMGAAFVATATYPRLPQLQAAATPQTAPINDKCGADVQQILNLAATVEALSMAFYYQAITTSEGFFRDLRSDYQRYLQLSLDEEWFHYHYLQEQRTAQPLTSTFYFPADVFAAGHFADFLAILDELETVTIAFYLAALRELGELHEPRWAEIFGQIAGIEAEQRVIGREMAQNGPPPPNNRCYEIARYACAALVTGELKHYLSGGAGFTGPVLLPDQAAIEDAVGAAKCDRSISTASATICQDTLTDSLAIAATAEAVGITLYYQAIQGGLFAQLNQSQQWYLQAALDEESNHLNFLLNNGAAAPPTQIFFAPNVFADLPRFLTLLDSLETAFIAAYLAAIQQFHQLGQPLLAEIAGQILGVEAGHRVLGRVLAKEPLPHNLGFARATYSCLADAKAALTPFVTGNADLTVPAPLPNTAAIDQAVDRFGCTPVSIAAPAFIYLPRIER